MTMFFYSFELARDKCSHKFPRGIIVGHSLIGYNDATT